MGPEENESGFQVDLRRVFRVGLVYLPAPGVIAQEITDDLQAALEQFAAIAEDLR